MSSLKDIAFPVITHIAGTSHTESHDRLLSISDFFYDFCNDTVCDTVSAAGAKHMGCIHQFWNFLWCHLEYPLLSSFFNIVVERHDLFCLGDMLA